METIDIGINLTSKQFRNDWEDALFRAQEAGVTKMVITGTSVKESRSASSYAEKYPNILYSTAGVHPHDAKGCNSDTIYHLKELCKKDCVVAVGECGLDYDRDFSPRDTQRRWFEKQIELSAEMNMPLFLHERAAFEDFYSIMKNAGKICEKSVVHCFTGTKRELENYLDLGCFIGITGWICDERRGELLRNIVKIIPKEKLMIETDAPYLIPRNLMPKPKSRRNEPAYLAHIAREIALCRGENAEILASYTKENANSFFSLV